ncbi:MAG TPA: PrsW family glutamic-type intramembrane protease [Candidatus Paceibacterota bacterium]|jgi:RsiW-degrading membrane proteinase PrsW (M82 family)
MELLNSIPAEMLGYAFVGGLLPPLVWLYFLLREDSRCPEPIPLLVIAFIAGMLAVPLALPLESLVRDYAYVFFDTCTPYAAICAPIIIGWSIIEEGLKYFLAAVLVLWRTDVNESVDFVIYMLTVALGFAALENVLFLVVPFASGEVLTGLATGNLRFIGSTLLHVMASSVIGFALAFSYLYARPIRELFGFAGLILAVGLHALFNFFIIIGDGMNTLFAFLIVWIAAVVFFVLFEVLRYFRYRNLPKNVC